MSVDAQCADTRSWRQRIHVVHTSRRSLAEHVAAGPAYVVCLGERTLRRFRYRAKPGDDVAGNASDALDRALACADQLKGGGIGRAQALGRMDKRER